MRPTRRSTGSVASWSAPRRLRARGCSAGAARLAGGLAATALGSSLVTCGERKPAERVNQRRTGRRDPCAGRRSPDRPECSMKPPKNRSLNRPVLRDAAPAQRRQTPATRPVTPRCSPVWTCRCARIYAVPLPWPAPSVRERSPSCVPVVTQFGTQSFGSGRLRRQRGRARQLGVQLALMPMEIRNKPQSGPPISSIQPAALWRTEDASHTTDSISTSSLVGAARSPTS